MYTLLGFVGSLGNPCSVSLCCISVHLTHISSHCCMPSCNSGTFPWGDLSWSPCLTPELSLIHQLPQRSSDTDKRPVCPCRAQRASHPRAAFQTCANTTTSVLTHVFTAVEPGAGGTGILCLETVITLFNVKDRF